MTRLLSAVIKWSMLELCFIALWYFFLFQPRWDIFGVAVLSAFVSSFAAVLERGYKRELVPNDVTFCNNCTYFRRGKEFSISSKFVASDAEPPYFDVVSDNAVPIAACQHPNCFTVTPHRNIISNTNGTTRIAGQAQFNKSNSCGYFKPKWYLITYGIKERKRRSV